jgi:hypothetical protein
VEGSCDYGNETSGSINYWEVLESRRAELRKLVNY